MARGEECVQFERRFTRIVLRKEMPARYRMSRHVVGPITPDAERPACASIPNCQRYNRIKSMRLLSRWYFPAADGLLWNTRMTATF